MKKHRPKLAPTVPNIFIQAVARERVLGPDPRDYPYSVPAIRHLTELRFETPVTFFVGENGSGKSTLLEGIAVAFGRSEEHTSELQSRLHLVCRLLLEKKNKRHTTSSLLPYNLLRYLRLVRLHPTPNAHATPPPH